MAVVIVTGSGGLVGAETVRFFAAQGFTVVGIDNDMRSFFFGPEASTAWSVEKLREELAGYRHETADIRDASAINAIFSEYGHDIELIVQFKD